MVLVSTFPCPAVFGSSKQLKILSTRSHDFLPVTKIKNNREVDLAFGKGKLFGKASNFFKVILNSE